MEKAISYDGSCDMTWSRMRTRNQKLADRKAAREFVEGIDSGAPGQLCILYLTGELDLIGALRWSGTMEPALGRETDNILGQGKSIGAEGFILARCDPNQNYYPDECLVVAVNKLRSISTELELPLLDYLVFPIGQTVSVSGPQIGRF